MENRGISIAEAEEKIKNGQSNKVISDTEKSVKQIIFENIFTYFNGIFALIAVLVIIVGSFNSLTFLPVIIANILIGIFQQVRAKKVLDKLSLLDVSEYTVIRDGQEMVVLSDELVLGDLVQLEGGQQIPADGYVENGNISVNESLLTGEADEISKGKGAELKSGSFAVAGNCYATLTHVGNDSYAAKLMEKAKVIKDKKSEMIRDIERIIKVAGILIIPVGGLLFYQSVFENGSSYKVAVESMVGAVIGMIPEGMYLLTTVALALSAMRLARNKVMLHDMRSIETLARVDVLCVDKTGTITTSKMSVADIFPPAGADAIRQEYGKSILKKYVHTIEDVNITMEALKDYYGYDGEKFVNPQIEPFSSKKKYSSITILGEGDSKIQYKFGAPEFILTEETFEKNRAIIEKRTKEGQRVLALAMQNIGDIQPIMFVSLKNEIRENAKDVFKYFEKQGVEVKVISGDNPLTVSKVASDAGIINAQNYIDATTLKTPESIEKAVLNTTVFGRVKPEQKKEIVRALKKNKLKIAMTGDGVNDILAMKEADCSIAMGAGSDAARQAAQVVLLDSDFSHMKKIVSEGRRDINNITRSAILFLYKNMFSLFLAIFSIINSFEYPLQPSQVSLVSMFNIGVPAFLLALEANEGKQEGSFIKQTLIKALPASITSFLSIAAMVLFAILFKIPQDDVGTASTYLLSVVGFMILGQIIKPANKYRVAVIALCVVGFFAVIFKFPALFALKSVSAESMALCVVFAIAEVSVMRWTTFIVTKISSMGKKDKTTKKKVK